MRTAFFIFVLCSSMVFPQQQPEQVNPAEVTLGDYHKKVQYNFSGMLQMLDLFHNLIDMEISGLKMEGQATPEKIKAKTDQTWKKYEEGREKASADIEVTYKAVRSQFEGHSSEQLAQAHAFALQAMSNLRTAKNANEYMQKAFNEFTDLLNAIE